MKWYLKLERKDMNNMFFVNKFLGAFLFIIGFQSALAQNKYTIDVELEPSQRVVFGQLEMLYTNLSNDTLNELWIHLYPNAYSSHHTPWAKQMIKIKELDFKYSRSFGYIDSLNFKSNGQSLTLMTSDEQVDVGVLLLNQPLLPGQSINIETPFKVKLAEMHSRAGYSGSFYSVTQWYPKFAVYENQTWQSMSYLEQGEFYSDFADYDVSVTLPSAYTFAATGYPSAPIDTTQKKITYRVELDSIHDFAWFASRKFYTQEKMIQLPSGKDVKLQVYVHQPEIANRVMSVMEYTILKMSEWVGEYPYEVCSVVEGIAGLGSGMEYPTICNIGASDMMDYEVAHEVVHNWWYGILANNERKEPFLDESFTSYYEKRIVDELKLNDLDFFGNMPKVAKYFGLNKLPMDAMNKTVILQQYRNNLHQPLNSTSEEFSYSNYFAMIYAKGALDIQHLAEFIGQENFDAVIQDFYQKHQFQHIDIEDLKHHFASYPQYNTKWFFDEVIPSKNLADFSVKKIHEGTENLIIEVQNKGKLTTPVGISILDKNQQELQKIFSEPIEGGSSTQITIPAKGAEYIWINRDMMIPESKLKNNYAKVNGLKSWKPLQIKFLGAAEDPTKHQLFFTPVLGGNQYDGFMLGLALYNRVFPAKTFEYELVPFFAFKSKQFNWIGNVSYHILPALQKPVDIEIGVHSKSFTMNDRPIDLKFIKLQPFISANFRKLNNDHGPHHQVGYRNIQIWADSYSSQRDSSTSEITFTKEKGQFNTHELWYELKHRHALYPNELKTVLRFDKNYVRHSIEYKQKIRYTQKGAFLHMRFFGGVFYHKNSDVSFRRNQVVGFNMSGINGRNDYLYDGAYFGRNAQEKFASKQMMMGEGNFKVFTPLQNPNEGKTVNGLFAINLKMDAPVKWLPIQLFLDLGYSVDKVIMPDNFLPGKQFHYDFGFNISLFDEAVEVYFPLLMSENYKTYYKSNLPKFGQRITFNIDIQKLNFHKILKKDLFQKMM